MRIRVAEVPCALLAQHTGWLAAFVELDDSARNLKVAVRKRERSRVQPERMAIARLERNRAVAADRVEVVPRRLDRRRPVAAPPASPAKPALPGLGQRLAHAHESFIERA